MSALAAVSYCRRGWAPLPIPHKTKAPTVRDWPKLRITEADAGGYFNGQPQNVGVILGEPSGNLVDIDLDCPEALALAPAFMPGTGSAFGRESKPRSHLLYTSAIPKRLEYADPDDGEMLLEVRTNGGQTVFPGSTHASGEFIEWAEEGDPAEVDPSQLKAAAEQLAVACLIVRAAPATDRHAYLLDVCGVLVRELGRDGAAHILAPAARLILGDLYRKADGDRLLDDTVRKLEAGEPVSGWPKLAERIGDKRCRKLSEWLGLPSAEQGHEIAKAFIATAEGKAVREAKPEPTPAVGIPYDAQLVLRPGGILQEFTDWIAGTSKRKQPILALGGATALVGLLCAHAYRIVHSGHDTRSNVLIVGLAASGSGKDHPRRCVKAILAELGMSDFVGEDIASGQALEGTFIDHFAQLFLVDEYGHRIKAALDPRGNPNEKKIVEVITKLATSAAGPYTHTRLAMNRHVAVPITYDPCLAMFATTVERPLWDGMQSGAVNDGSVARHLFLKTEADYPDNDYGAPHFEERLPEMVGHAWRIMTGPWSKLEAHRRRAGLRATYQDDGRGGSERVRPEKPVVLALPIGADAKAELRRLDEEELALLRAHQRHGTNALVGRLVEHTTRLALICAVSDNPEAPALAARHVLWGEAVVKCSLNTVLRAAAVHVADSEHQKSRNRLLQDVMRASEGKWITKRQITFASRWAKSSERNVLLPELVELGLVQMHKETRGGQPVVEFRCA